MDFCYYCGYSDDFHFFKEWRGLQVINKKKTCSACTPLIACRWIEYSDTEEEIIDFILRTLKSQRKKSLWLSFAERRIYFQSFERIALAHETYSVYKKRK